MSGGERLGHFPRESNLVAFDHTICYDSIVPNRSILPIGKEVMDVKKVSILLMLVVFISVSLASVSSASGKVSGEVVKMEGEFLTIKDGNGKTHKFHVDTSTRKSGNVRAGSHVEVDATPSGHAKAIMVKQDMDDDEEEMEEDDE